jgi:hypothetical protein
VSLYVHRPHPRIEERKDEGPVKVADQLPGKRGNRVTRFNSTLALGITRGVGSMWCAYIFAAIALVSLPDAIRAGRPAVISWIAQTFLQLVLLSIILVGQDIQLKAGDKRSEQTFNDAEAMLAEGLKIQEHLAAQDAAIEAQSQRLAALILLSEKRHL